MKCFLMESFKAGAKMRRGARACLVKATGGFGATNAFVVVLSGLAHDDGGRRRSRNGRSAACFLLNARNLLTDWAEQPR